MNALALPLAASGFFLVLSPADPWVAGAEIERTVEFRDGSVLRLTLPDSSLAFKRAVPNGSVISETMKLSEIKELKLAQKPAVEEVARISALVRDLGNDAYATRERAQAELLASAAGFRPLLKEMYEQTTDAEIRWRLKQIFAKLPPGQKEPDRECDRLQPVSGGEPIQCDVGNWNSRGRFHDLEVKLDRTLIRRINAAAIESQKPAASVAIRVERIKSDDDRAFPEKIARIDFKNAPDGKPLGIGQDVGKTFIPSGITIETSIPNAIVSVNDYNVAGRSGGLSCATHQPLWEGILTIRFCLPGNDRIPAGVTHVGLWIAAVSPDGTKLEAYDAHDRLLAEIKTVAQGHDFLAVRSNIPIAYIKVVPNPRIDPNGEMSICSH